MLTRKTPVKATQRALLQRESARHTHRDLENVHRYANFERAAMMDGDAS